MVTFEKIVKESDLKYKILTFSNQYSNLFPDNGHDVIIIDEDKITYKKKMHNSQLRIDAIGELYKKYEAQVGDKVKLSINPNEIGKVYINFEHTKKIEKIDEDLKKRMELYEASDRLKEIERRFFKEELFEILAIGRDEVKHSRFLKWLFELRINGKFSSLIFFSKLLAQRTSDNLILQNIANGKTEIESMKVVTEKGVSTKQKNGRIDIFIEICTKDKRDITFTIENKVYSTEHSEQTQTYYNAIQRDKKYANYSNFFIFLTPMPVSQLNDRNSPECKEYIEIRYQDIVDEIIEPLIKEIKDEKNTELFYLSLYLHCLRHSKDYYVTDDYIIALSQNDIDLIHSFWDENHELFALMIDLCERNEKIDDVKEFLTRNRKYEKIISFASKLQEDRDWHKIDLARYSSVQISNRAYNLYTITWDEEVVRSGLTNGNTVLEIVKLLHEKRELNDEMIAVLKKFHILKDPEKNVSELHHTRYAIGNVEYKILTGLNQNSAIRFFNEMKKRFSKLEYIVHKNGSIYIADE